MLRSSLNLTIVAIVTFLTVSIVLPQHAVAQQTVIYVDGDSSNTSPADATTNPGSNWGGAFKYLQNGLQRADQIHVQFPTAQLEIWVAGDDDANGVRYFPDQGYQITDDNREAAFNLRELVTIYCGFAAGESNLNNRDALKYKVYLSGDIDNEDGLDDDNSLHVVVADHVANTVIIDGAIVTGGYADGEDQDSGGGGMLVLGEEGSQPEDGSTPVILRCRFTGNYGLAGGAVLVMDAQFSDPQFRNCTFDSNESDGDGGAIECFDFGSQGGAVELRLINCLFHGNAAGGMGGAIHCDNFAFAMLLNCTASQNSTVSDGAVAHDAEATGEPNFDGYFEIYNTIIYGNTHPGDSNRRAWGATLRLDWSVNRIPLQLLR